MTDWRQPEWSGPSDNIMEAAVPLQVVLLRNDRLAVYLRSFRAAPNGVLFDLSIRIREQLQPSRFRPMEMFHVRGPLASLDQIPAELFRLGVIFADGRSASTVDRRPFGQGEPNAPVLQLRGGGGGGRRFDHGCWLWPLPPPGPLTFVCEWPYLNVGETRVEVDCTELVSAAARAVELWPDDRPVLERGGMNEVFAPRDPDSREGQFQVRCQELITEIRALGFNPNRWVAMINTIGAVPAAKKLLHDDDVLAGTPWLVERRRAELTLEQEILQQRWRDLFTDEERAKAANRLSGTLGGDQ